MYHRLLVAAEVVGELRILVEGLSDAGHVAVTEDPKAARRRTAIADRPGRRRTVA